MGQANLKVIVELAGNWHNLVAGHYVRRLLFQRSLFRLNILAP